jgi:hypothetical protein
MFIWTTTKEATEDPGTQVDYHSLDSSAESTLISYTVYASQY